jgi:hypothetical protein
MSSWLDAIKAYFEIRNRAWVNLDTREFLQQVCPSKDVKWYKYVRHLIERKHQALQLQGKRLLRVHSTMRVHDAEETSAHGIRVHVDETIYWVYQDRGKFAVESRVIIHRQEWSSKRGHWFLTADLESNEKEKYVENIRDPDSFITQPFIPGKVLESDRQTSQYDRVKAIRYADLWWNGYNSIYPALDDDCTNFISQCLHAGRLGMTKPTNRSAGWWYRFDGAKGGEPWSYSWTVSQVLYQYLTRSVGVTRVSAAKDLKMGDLVFYDWDGSGKFHHTTIVTDFDEYGDPLVNAHSDSSFHRPYTYFDSRAWSKRTRYSFIHLPDQFNTAKRNDEAEYEKRIYST